MTKPEPFLLQPAGKDYLWGGNRLHTLFGKQLPLHPLAETWECSTHPDGCSIVASGVDKGKSLAEVLQQHPEFLGAKTSTTGDLSVLVKLQQKIYRYKYIQMMLMHNNMNTNQTEKQKCGTS